MVDNLKVVIKPTANKLLVKLASQSDETKSGLKIVKKDEQWQEETVKAEILAKHDGVKDVEVGEVVLIAGHAGKWLDPGLIEEADKGFIYRIIEADEIIAVLDLVGG